jgi:hypothetical protein
MVNVDTFLICLTHCDKNLSFSKSLGFERTWWIRTLRHQRGNHNSKDTQHKGQKDKQRSSKLYT